LVVEEKTAAFLSDTLFVSCCTLLSIYMNNVIRAQVIHVLKQYMYIQC